MSNRPGVAIRSWAYRRDGYSPDSGNVLAKTAKEALKLVHFMHGYASNTTVFCAETGEKWVDTYKGIRRVKK